VVEQSRPLSETEKKEVHDSINTEYERNMKGIREKVEAAFRDMEQASRDVSAVSCPFACKLDDIVKLGREKPVGESCGHQACCGILDDYMKALKTQHADESANRRMWAQLRLNAELVRRQSAGSEIYGKYVSAREKYNAQSKAYGDYRIAYAFGKLNADYLGK
jgi:hypothetical protein